MHFCNNLCMYGESIPGDITSTDDLTTLSVEQALADAAAFVAFVTRTWLQGQQLVWVSGEALRSHCD